MKILAGIVTYNPDIIRLKENIEAVINQVQSILIFDNASSNFQKISELVELYSTVTIIRSTDNLGIASALKEIMQYGERNSYDWILTLDQDSIVRENLIKTYKSYLNIKSVGMLTCLIEDRNFKSEKIDLSEYEEVPYCITSGSLTNVFAYNNVAGYDDDFFIDCVDFDICYQLREKKFKILRINYNGLLHEVGHGCNKKFLFENIVVYNESSLRRYYIARNTIWLSKKHPKLFPFYIAISKELKELIRILFYEKDRICKLKSWLIGIRDGLIMKASGSSSKYGYTITRNEK